MKYFAIVSVLLVLSFKGTNSKQVLVVTNLENIKGKLYIGWYKSAEEFRKADKAVFQKIVEVENKESVEIPFDNVPAGTYAIAIFLDKNGNGKIDTNMLGIPKEKYGFSNNKYPLTRAATFKESAFTVGEKETSITIKLKG
jgi:uncharacterized protein (DUF2141 family)